MKPVSSKLLYGCIYQLVMDISPTISCIITRTRAPLPEGAAGQGRLRGLRKKSRHARVREFESRFPLQAGQHIAGLLFFTEDSNSRPAPRGSCRPGPAEASTEKSSVNKRDRR